MAPSALPFKPSYTVLKNLYHKVYKYSITLANITLPTQLQDLTIDVYPYLDNTIGILSNLTAFLYNNDAPQAIKVTEVKKGIEKIDIKVDKVKAKVTEVKAKVAEVKAKVAEVKAKVIEVKAEVKSLEECLTVQVNNIKIQVNNVRASLYNYIVI